MSDTTVPAGTRAIPMIEISGGPRERGRVHGEAARQEIARSMAYYEEAYGAATGLTWESVVDEARKWRPVVAAASEELLEEMAGIAEGAGVSEMDILALNARGEIVRAADSRFGRSGWEAGADAGHDEEGCSTFAILPGGSGVDRVFSGQNWDWRSGTEDTTIVIRIVQPGKPTIIQQVEAGQVGRHGANSAGLALQANGLSGDFGRSIGLPQPVLRRLILDSAIMHDALQAAVTARLQIAVNLLMVHRDGLAVAMETTPGSHRWSTALRGRVVHTNHYQYGVPDEIGSTYRPSSMSSVYRLPLIEAGLARLDDVATPDKLHQVVREVLSDHFSYPCSVCEHDDDRLPRVEQYKTLMSSLIDLTSGEYRVTGGNPCANDYTLVPWNLHDGPGGQ
ncbi:acyl-coenzyme A--6-aminopenicillanic-acid-acyltransferase form [Streptomyces sp. HC44]|uniref:Acyl-coenzyme A--6-aminopenicillanic-acid-acyltransferase form n=1 Tax=Streptomyces scabichelini TaxID=2711217 RepID=A0A6G4VH96_9ACTN|nr:C45 family peptidase [Streptomyces scabichelini]NGO13153.1 acyl-coenzyme A--6-aminopenicillanic-acid-acyltransferase form [Streptomyces scabichelini]